ncbi:hypothetical protein AAEO56_07770 [Flavobacterium sp. DGU11]|uniref:Uncharacterized protein n=1 Tax=Flavobacterium arundinis TaxID=3139143 RepID=A0ABU9HVZ0_9FLAO
MIKKLIFLLLVITFSGALAQGQDNEGYEATLYFRDGTNIAGFGDIKRVSNFSAYEKSTVIIFKLAKTDEAEEWNGEMVDRIIFHGFEFSVTFQFVPTPENRRNSYELLRLITEGEVNLYSSIDDYFTELRYVDMKTPGLKMPHTPVNNFGPVIPVMSKPTGHKYYMRRQNETKFFNFSGSKKKIAAYFNDCSGIAKKLETGDFTIDTLKEIVEYYNDLCAGYTEDSDKSDDGK